MLKPLTRFALALVIPALLAVSALAQTTSATLVYDSSDALSAVQGYQTFVKIGSAAATQVTPTCVSKAQSPNLQTECSLPLATLPPSGTQITVTLSNGIGIGATTFTEGGGPASPVNVKITITVSVP